MIVLIFDKNKLMDSSAYEEAIKNLKGLFF